MKGYVFTYGVDGFGADTAPAFEEGCYLNYKKAFEHFKELTQKSLSENERYFYEDGYREDCFPEEDKELTEAYENENWNLFDELMEKHILTDINDICLRIMDYGEPPFGFYKMEEIEIIN